MADPNEWNTSIIEEFRSNDGKVGGVFEGRPLLLLHTTGAKSGVARLHPLMYQTVGDSFAIFASKGGAPSNPAWFHNLTANPDCDVELGDGSVAVTARIAEGEERDRIWSQQKQDYAFFGEYEQKAGREIPVVVLERR